VKVKFGFTNDSQEEETKPLGFVPSMFANKNKKVVEDDDRGPNTISKMFKNAPPPRAKPKRTVGDISGSEDPEVKNESSQKLKTSSNNLESLDRFKL
jgi:hypothetical protein